MATPIIYQAQAPLQLQPELLRETEFERNKKKNLPFKKGDSVDVQGVMKKHTVNCVSFLSPLLQKRVKIPA